LPINGEENSHVKEKENGRNNSENRQNNNIKGSVYGIFDKMIDNENESQDIGKNEDGVKGENKNRH
jgi:hypothetical protein